MILYLSIILVISIGLFIFFNRQSPRTNEVAVLLIIYAVTLLSFYLSDINKRKPENYPTEKRSTYSSYVAYSKKDRHIKEIPLMRYYATTAGTTVYSESLPAFLLRISQNPDHVLDDKKPFKHKRNSHFLRDYMELKIIDVLVISSSNYQQPEPHASTIRFATNVSIDQDVKRVIKSTQRISLEELSNKLKDNQLYQSFLADNQLNGWLTAHWKDGIAIPQDTRVSLTFDHPNEKECRIVMTFHSKHFPFLSGLFKDSLTINVYVDDEAEEGIHFGAWLTAYNNPENFGTYMDYIVTEPDLTVQTEFSSFTLWNPSHMVYQKWLDYLYESLKFKLDFAEDYKYIDRRMMQSIFESTSVIKHRLDEIEKKVK